MKREDRHLSDELLGAYLDGELNAPALRAVSDHLRVCSECSDAAEALGALGSAARRIQAPMWDLEAMVALVDAGISAPGAGDEMQSDARVGGAGAAGLAGLADLAGRAARWAQSRQRLAMGLAVAAALLISVLGAAGYVYRREMIAEDTVLVRSHYIVRSGNVGALLVSYPGR